MKMLILGICILCIGVTMSYFNFNPFWSFFVVSISAIVYFRGAFLIIQKINDNEKSRKQ